MANDDISIFAMLKSRLTYLADRQQVISQNVANSDTPGFTPKDLKPFALPGRAGSAGALRAGDADADLADAPDRADGGRGRQQAGRFARLRDHARTATPWCWRTR